MHMHAWMERLAGMVVTLALAVWCSRAVPYSVMMREAAELQVFKSGLKDPKRVTANWLPNIYPCRWNGITCKDDNKIIYVMLKNSNLEGPLTEGLSKLSSLEALNLSGNRLYGTIPPAFGNWVTTRDLNLSYNRLTGPIPATLGGIPALDGKLDLSHNLLEGPIPPQLGNLRGIRFFILARNRLTGNIPPSLGNFEAVFNLDLSRNRLSGSIPASLGNMWKAVYIDLSSNSLEGRIPEEMGGVESLIYFNVSYNRLSGRIPDTPSFQLFPDAYFANNSGLCGGNTGTACTDNPESQATALTFFNGGGMPTSSVAASAVAIGALLAFGLSLWVYVAKRHPHILGYAADAGTGGGGGGRTAPMRSFTSQELLLATSNFDASNFLGEGSHCSTFLGCIDPETIAEHEAINNQVAGENQNQLLVAIKCLHPHLIGPSEEVLEEGGAESFICEWKARDRLRHPNLVSVLGWCHQEELVAVVLEYAANGTLHMQLHNPANPTSLAWDQRLNIALGIATGLKFLHNPMKGSTRMACNLTLTKVLLDEYYNPRLADYRTKLKLSDFVPGTTYVAPELAEGVVTLATSESEVYSFGILALELITGMDPDTNFVDLGYGIAEWVQQQFPDNALDAIDPVVLSTCVTHEHVITFMKMALMCTNSVAEERPQMSEVLSCLQNIAKFYNGDRNLAYEVVDYGETNNVQYEDYGETNNVQYEDYAETNNVQYEDYGETNNVQYEDYGNTNDTYENQYGSNWGPY